LFLPDSGRLIYAREQYQLRAADAPHQISKAGRIMIACFVGDLETLRRVNAEDLEAMDCRTACSERMPLAAACETNQVEALRMLLELYLQRICATARLELDSSLGSLEGLLQGPS